jgi:hypothetical protein
MPSSGTGHRCARRPRNEFHSPHILTLAFLSEILLVRAFLRAPNQEPVGSCIKTVHVLGKVFVARSQLYLDRK